MTTPQRIALALAACENLTDAELKERGPGSFLAMIKRKREYAGAARILSVNSKMLHAQLTKALDDMEKIKNEILQLEALDSPITDTSQADKVLADFMKKDAQ